MGSSWLLFLLLTLLTGNPISALALILLIGWLGDHFTFRVLPDPIRIAARWRRIRHLRRMLAVNPHDRRSRLELAELLATRRPRESADVLRPNIEAGDQDAHTAFVYGTALARAGAFDEAERVLAFAREADPNFRMGEIDLEIGRLRLARGNHQGASEALQRLVTQRPGTVQGRYLLSGAVAKLGDTARAQRLRREAWREYKALPRFRRREERPFAWRLRPLRAVAAVAGAIAAVAVGLACITGVLMGEDVAKAIAGQAGESHVVGDDFVVIHYAYRLGQIRWIVVCNWPASAKPEDRLADERLDVVAETVRSHGARRHLRGPPQAYLFDGDDLTAFPIAMKESDLDAMPLNEMKAYPEILAYLRRFEVQRGHLGGGVR